MNLKMAAILAQPQCVKQKIYWFPIKRNSDLNKLIVYQHDSFNMAVRALFVSEKGFYCKISWSLEAARFVSRIVQSLVNLTGTSATLLLMYLKILQ